MRSSFSLSVLLCFLFSQSPLLSQGGVFKPSRTEAEIAWNTGNYEKAYEHYNALLLLYSRDPSYKYFTGACLVRLERDPSRAVTLLGSAINSSLNVKTVPDDVWFYYGRALQMNGRCSEAGEAFGKFVKNAGKKQAQDYEVQRFIDQCRTIPVTTGAKSPEHTMPRETEDKKTIEMVKGNVRTEAGMTEPGHDRKDSSDMSLTHMNKEVLPVPEDYDVKLTRALRLQYEADSLIRVANAIKRTSETVPSDKKGALLVKAVSLEKEASVKVSEGDSLLLTLEPAGQTVSDGSNKIEAVFKVEAKEEIIGSGDSRNVDTSVIKLKPLTEKPVFSVFEIRSAPAYSATDPIPVGKGTPNGLVYRIQLAAFKNPVPASHFKGMYPIYGKIKPENGVTYYYAGIFRTIESARNALQRVRTAGFPDAFVAAMMDDSPLSMERALILEKEWSNKPLFYEKGNSPGEAIQTVSDSIPVGTLYFRAEVLRSKKAVQPEVAEKIQLLSGRRGLDIIKNKQGETLFLVGNFITFESAEEYVSLLVRNGYTSARVVAYIGAREIAVEAARELLKKLTDD